MPEIFSAMNPEYVAVSLPTWVDLASVVVGSFGGVMVARARHLDAVGFIGLALLCGLGGGLIRDVMMQVGSVYMLDSPFAIPLSSISTLLPPRLGFTHTRRFQDVLTTYGQTISELRMRR